MIKFLKWNDAQKELSKTKVTYLWFGTEWCGDCQMMFPIIDEVANEYRNNELIQFIKVDAEEAKLFRIESIYQVKKVPTHIFIKEGKINNILYEYVPKEMIEEEINKLI